MTILTVRNVPDEVHRALHVRAAMRSRSPEAEVRAILKDAVAPEGRIGYQYLNFLARIFRIESARIDVSGIQLHCSFFMSYKFGTFGCTPLKIEIAYIASNKNYFEFVGLMMRKTKWVPQ